MGIHAERPLKLDDEVGITQLDRRHIHRNAPHIETRDAPMRMIFHRAAERPAPNFINQSGFFKTRDKTSGHDKPRLRIVPSDQGFGAGEFAARKTELRLIKKHELFFFEGQAQLRFQTEPADHRIGHGGGIEQIAMAPRFGLFERGLGIPE